MHQGTHLNIENNRLGFLESLYEQRYSMQRSSGILLTALAKLFFISSESIKYNSVKYEEELYGRNTTLGTSCSEDKTKIMFLQNVYPD